MWKTFAYTEIRADGVQEKQTFGNQEHEMAWLYLFQAND